MQDFIHHRLWTGAAGLTLACLLLQGCSTYRPLGRGADVPWAKAGQLASADGMGIRPAGSLSVAQLSGLQHRVIKGDRLSSLARAYGVTVHALADVNALEPPYVIYVGQVLQLPKRGDARRRATPITAADGGYRVRPGDTLSGLANRLDVAMSELAAINQLDAPYRLEVGQRLRVPQPSVVQVAVRSEPRSTPHATDGPPPLSGEGFLWPVNGKLIGGFGEAKDGQMRAGIDIAARKGTPVLASEDGVVVYADNGIRGYGKLVLIRHDEDYITTYAHNSALLVEVGANVRRGQVIARVGDSGDVADSQLHFELRKGRQPIDPETMLVGRPTEVASSS
jgi:murein DD-endopeptidase MepM/ murein hydrolase activator NlpD